MRNDIVALYVDRLGPYPKLVEQWYDKERDANTYTGALPVVAHPACAPWSRLRHLNKYQSADDALHALRTLRRVGGVLEHPNGSQLWKYQELPKPGESHSLPNGMIGFSIEVEQVNWGHVARKRTWLYIVCERAIHADGRLVESRVNEVVIDQPPPREPTHWASGGRKLRPGYKESSLVPPGIKVCSAQQRRRTPIAFAEWLLEVASRCRR